MEKLINKFYGNMVESSNELLNAKLCAEETRRVAVAFSMHCNWLVNQDDYFPKPYEELFEEFVKNNYIE